MPEDPNKIFIVAEKHRVKSRFLSAIPLYVKAYELSGSDVALKADCAFCLGDTCRMTGGFKTAARWYKEAHALSLKIWKSGKAGGEAVCLDALVGLGLSKRAVGELNPALLIFNACLGRYKKLGDMAGVAFTMWARAGALRLKGDITGALKGFSDAKEIFRAHKDISGAGYCLTGLGGAHRVAGDYALSGKYYKDANRVFTGSSDTFGIAYSYCGIANSLRMRGRFKESLGYFKKAKTNYKKIGDKVSYAYTLWGEGSAFLMLGKDSQAGKDFASAYKLFKETGDRRGVVYCMISTGQIEFSRSRSKGVATIKKALKEAEGLGIKTEARYAKEALKAMEKSPEKLPLNLA
jgi:tetratricopeptide (TPR) repeat protein